MKRKNNLLLGHLGENLAATYLCSLGYQILERNFRKRYGEIDIIAKEKEILVFVEVKLRKGKTFGSAAETITSHKLRALISSVQYYQLTHKCQNTPSRLDLVAIDLPVEAGKPVITLYRNITG